MDHNFGWCFLIICLKILKILLSYLNNLRRYASLRKSHENQNSFAMSTFEHLLLCILNSKMLTNLWRRSSIISQKILKILSTNLENQRIYAFLKHIITIKLAYFCLHSIWRVYCMVLFSKVWNLLVSFLYGLRKKHISVVFRENLMKFLGSFEI